MKLRSLISDNSAFQWAVGAVAISLTTLVAIVIGVMVWYKTSHSLYYAYSATGTKGALGAVFNNTNTTANTVWALAPIVAIVLIAGVILAVIMGFGRNQ